MLSRIQRTKFLELSCKFMLYAKNINGPVRSLVNEIIRYEWVTIEAACVYLNCMNLGFHFSPYQLLMLRYPGKTNS